MGQRPARYKELHGAAGRMGTMPSDKFIAYYCVNAGRKGRKHPGLEVQRAAVMSFLNRGHWTLVERHTEELRRGGARPVLADALAACRAHDAALVIADSKRLEGDDRFMAEVRRAGVECWAVETLPADRPLAPPRPLAKPLMDHDHSMIH